MSNRQRRNRNLKLMIIAIFFMMVLLLILTVFLLFKTGSMQKEIDAIKVAKAQAAQAASAGAGSKDGTLTKSSETQDASDAADASDVTAAPDAVTADAQDPQVTAAPLPADAKVVYLTFDDGPSKNTQNILDVLAENDVHATFFVNGRTDDDSIARYQAIAAGGHEIAMHSYSHDYEYVYASVDNFVADLDKIQNLITEVTGKTPMVYRFPGGSSNTLSVRKQPMADFISALLDRGIVYFDWNVDSTDGEGANRDVQTLIDKTKSGLDGKKQQYVVLMHDAGDHDTTVQALPSIIQYCKEQGYAFDVITSDTPEVHHATIS